MARRLFFATALLAAIGLMLIGPSARSPVAAGQSPMFAGPSAAAMATSGLSSYWHYKIQRWEGLILQEAERRLLDPDFLAALVWLESRGDPKAVGPVGAVGLMQVMPKEAGFSWRPTEEALKDPSTNLYWGSRTLAIVVRQGKGDIFSALAAYNGGWEKTTYRGPTRFATRILRDYANALVTRHGLGQSWVAVFAVKEANVHGPIWIADSTRDDVYAYGPDNVTPQGGPLVPDVAPTSVVASCYDENVGTPCEVGVWLFDQETQQWISPLLDIPVPDVTEEPTAVPATATSEPAAASPGAPSVYVMAGSSRPAGSGSTTQEPSPTAAPTINAEVAAPPPESGGETDTGTAHKLALASEVTAPEANPELPACAGGPLTLDAWPLDRDFIVGTETTPEGWKVRIYAEGRGSDCVYTYAWNDESDIRAANVRGATTFEVTSTRRDCPILGTVVVYSGDSVMRVGMYINPPK